MLKDEQPDNLSTIEAKRYEILPKEADEESTPRIKLYNEMVRHAMTYDTEMFSRCGVTSNEELERIYY